MKQIVVEVFVRLNKRCYVDKTYELLGFIQGDGVLTDLSNKTKKGIAINIGYKDLDVKTYFSLPDFDKSGRVIYLNNRPDIIKLLFDLEFDKQILPKREFPKTFRSWSEIEKLQFIRGMYSANGSVIGGKGGGRVSYKTTSIELVKVLVETLELFGYNPTVTYNKPNMVDFSNGRYLCKGSYDVNLNRKLDKVLFYYKIGFIQNYKNEKLYQFIK
jgi:hypothetical protein